MKLLVIYWATSPGRINFNPQDEMAVPNLMKPLVLWDQNIQV